MVHPTEALTSESVQTLASYIASRYRALGGHGTLLEVRTYLAGSKLMLAIDT